MYVVDTFSFNHVVSELLYSEWVSFGFTLLAIGDWSQRRLMLMLLLRGETSSLTA